MFELKKARDMGKTVYLPQPTTADATSNASGYAGGISSVFRKVQYIPTGANQSNGVGGDSATTYYTGYIRLGGALGGGTGVPTGVARLG